MEELKKGTQTTKTIFPVALGQAKFLLHAPIPWQYGVCSNNAKANEDKAKLRELTRVQVKRWFRC